MKNHMRIIISMAIIGIIVGLIGDLSYIAMQYYSVTGWPVEIGGFSFYFVTLIWIVMFWLVVYFFCYIKNKLSIIINIVDRNELAETSIYFFFIFMSISVPILTEFTLLKLITYIYEIDSRYNPSAPILLNISFAVFYLAFFQMMSKPPVNSGDTIQN